MTLQQAAKLAIDIQDACNLSGVLGSFNTIVHDVLWPEARRLNKGTDWVNQHPICTLFLDKLCDLNRVQREVTGFSQAYDKCERLSKDPSKLTVDELYTELTTDD